MADNLIVTQDAKFEIISAKPSINKKQVGPNVVEIPYDVSQTLDKAVDVSPNVKANGKPVVLMSSTMPEVIGDEEGSLGGVDSGTVGGPTKCTQGSSTVTINGQKAIRVDDTMDMQGGNTFGKITMSSSSSNAITDEFNKKVLEDLHEFLNSPAKESLENINSPSTSRPGATNEAGCLGSSTGSPVLLNTRQLYLKQTDLTFKGINPIDVKRVYVARNHKNNNMFGNHWLFFYAQRFVNITQELESEEDKTRFKISNIDYSKNITYDMLNYSQTNKDKLVQEKKTKHIYNLYLNDSRVFEFEYDLKNDSFKDLGKLGVSIQKTNDTYIITYNDGKKETYTNENLVLIEDKNNNKISMVFNHNNQIVMIKNHCNTISLTYNNNNQVEYIKDNVSRVTKYKYDTNNNLIEVIDAKNNITKYVYKSIKEKNNSISYLLTNHLHNDVSLLNATYDNKAQVKSYNDKQTVYNYRFDQNSVKKTNSMKESVIYGLDSYGLIKAISLDHKLVQAVEFNKKTNTLEYKLNDKIIKHEIYDNQSRLLKTIDINPMSFEKNIIKEYEYTKGVTLPIKITNHKTNTIQTYDNNGNLLELLENNLKQTYEYNKDGQIIKYTNNNNIQTLYEYDEHKRLIKQINPNNQIILFKYDLLNNLVKVIDQEQRVTSYVYDKLNYLTKTINGNGYITTYTYDNNNLLTHISDANKNTTTYTYNKHNNIIKESNNLGTKDISYANNNLINTISFNLNTQTQITRDDKNNIIKTSIGDEYILYEYDKKDNLISAKRYTNNKLACVLQYEYNTNNKLISCIQDGIEIKRRYNHEKDNSSLKHILFLNEVISYDINPKTNLLDQITIGLHDINLEYNNNQLTKKTFTSYLKSDEINMDNLEQTIQLNHKRDLHNQIDINNKIIKQTQTMFYDTNNQIEQISTNNTNIKYQRDKTNLITQIDDNEKITNYAYDNGKRLISACDDKINLKTIQKQPQHIKSDILNLTNDKFVISNFLQEPIKEEKINIDGFTQYEYDKVGNLLNNNSVYKNNQLVQNDNYYYVYDKAGNLKAKKSTTTSKQIEYRYNNFNELISVKYYIKAKLVKTLLFTYDALRRRASKQLIDNINNYKHYYLYDGLNIIAILDSNKQLLSTITHNNELDSPLSITTNNKTYFYYTNAQGSITHLTNCHGNIVEKISYDAYGNITNHIQKEKTNNIYFFTAKQKDDIDLYYYKFRYYDATTFRFICLDPISHESNDTNHYSYVFNDPLNQTDDLGLYTPGSLSLALNPIKPPTQYKKMLGQTTKTNIQKQSLQTETKEFKTPTIKEIVANAPRDGVKILAIDEKNRPPKKIAPIAPWTIVQKNRSYVLNITEVQNNMAKELVSKNQTKFSHELHCILPPKDKDGNDTYLEFTSNHEFVDDKHHISIRATNLDKNEYKDLNNKETFKISSSGNIKDSNEDDLPQLDLIPYYEDKEQPKIQTVFKWILNNKSSCNQTITIQPFSNTVYYETPKVLILFFDQATYEGSISMTYNSQYTTQKKIDNKGSNRNKTIDVQTSAISIDGKFQYIKGDTTYTFESKHSKGGQTKTVKRKHLKRIDAQNIFSSYQEKINNFHKTFEKLQKKSKKTPVSFELGTTKFELKAKGATTYNEKNFTLDEKLQNLEVGIAFFDNSNIRFDVLDYIISYTGPIAGLVKKARGYANEKGQTIIADFSMGGSIKGNLKASRQNLQKPMNFEGKISGNINFEILTEIAVSGSIFTIKTRSGAQIKTGSEKNINEKVEIGANIEAKTNDKNELLLDGNIEFNGMAIYYSAYIEASNGDKDSMDKDKKRRGKDAEGFKEENIFKKEVYGKVPILDSWKTTKNIGKLENLIAIKDA